MGLDEAHEINKATVVRPSKEYLDKIMYYYPARAQVCKNLKNQVVVQTPSRTLPAIIDMSPYARRCEYNMSCMSAKIRDSQVLDLFIANTQLRTIGGVWATPEQDHDLLCFREIGIRMYIEYFIVGICSAKVPLRLKHLQTFASRNKSDKKIKLREK